VETGQGATIASPWPLGAVREVDQHVTPRTAGFAVITLIAEVAAPAPFGSPLFANHVPNWQLSFEHERELQAVRVARAIEAQFVGRPAPRGAGRRLHGEFLGSQCALSHGPAILARGERFATAMPGRRHTRGTLARRLRRAMRC
jgi:hypothetical protein